LHWDRTASNWPVSVEKEHLPMLLSNAYLALKEHGDLNVIHEQQAVIKVCNMPRYAAAIFLSTEPKKQGGDLNKKVDSN